MQEEKESSSVSSQSSATSLLESIARVTFAGMGGALAGLARSRQQGRTAAPGGSVFHRSPSFTYTARRPMPRMSSSPLIGSATVNLPYTWAISCMLFATIMEVCRVTSPTQHFIDHYTNQDNNTRVLQQLDEPKTTTDIPQHGMRQYIQVAFVAMGDMTIGGTMAGFASASALRRRIRATNYSRSFLVWGTGMGAAFGCLVGIVQACVDVGILYSDQGPQQLDEQEQ